MNWPDFRLLWAGSLVMKGLAGVLHLTRCMNRKDRSDVLLPMMGHNLTKPGKGRV